MRKLDPDYAVAQAPVTQRKPAQQNQVNVQKESPQVAMQKQYVGFNQRVKDILAKINEALKREGLSKEELY